MKRLFTTLLFMAVTLVVSAVNPADYDIVQISDTMITAPTDMVLDLKSPDVIEIANAKGLNVKGNNVVYKFNGKETYKYKYYSGAFWGTSGLRWGMILYYIKLRGDKYYYIKARQ